MRYIDIAVQKPGWSVTVVKHHRVETRMKKMISVCFALMLLGSLSASPVWAGRGHGHHHHGHGHHHHHRGGGHGGIGLALGMGLLGYGLGVYSSRAPHYPPSYGYPPAAYGPNYGYAPAYGPSAPPVYIQQWFR